MKLKKEKQLRHDKALLEYCDCLVLAAKHHATLKPHRLMNEHLFYNLRTKKGIVYSIYPTTKNVKGLGRIIKDEFWTMYAVVERLLMIY